MMNKNKTTGKTFFDLIGDYPRVTLIIIIVLIMTVVGIVVLGKVSLKIGIFEINQRKVDTIYIVKKDTVIIEKSVIPEFRKTEVTNKDNKPSTKIDASNALIVTNEQKGGINTVINPRVDVPLPIVKNENWNIKNQIVYKIINKIKRDTISIPNKDIPNKFLYHNQIEINYTSQIARNQIAFRIKRTDIVHGDIFKIGKISGRNGKTNEGWFIFMLDQPENGIYTIDLYSVDIIKDVLNEVDYLI